MATYQSVTSSAASSTSINRVLSRALLRLAPADLEFHEFPIGNLPLYSSE
jgi:chromate reductase